MNWNGAEFLAACRAEARERVAVAGEVVSEYAKEIISTPWPPASLPGESPHLRTGNLRESVQTILHPSEAEASVGTDVNYGRFLELGQGLPARPWLMKSLIEKSDEVKQILTGT